MLLNYTTHIVCMLLPVYNTQRAPPWMLQVLPFFQFYRGSEGRVDEFPASVSRCARTALCKVSKV